MAITALTPQQRQAIRRARERAGLTQTQLAARIGIVSQYVNMIETGKKAASLDVLTRLGNELGLDISVKVVVSIKPKRRS
jgi:transcriptional regulator with XRE-family HTH domain